MLAVIAAGLIFTHSALATDLDQNLAAAAQRSAAVLRHGRLAYQFVDLETGSVLAQKDENTALAPASNLKLFTTALALARLGPDYKFRTELRTSGDFTAGQPKISDLLLIGGGDPNLSGRVVPYAVDSTDDDPLKALKDLAAQLYQNGIREITGDVTGVATRYPGDLYPDGWTIDDSDYDYGAPISSLTINDNTVSVTVRPTEPDDLADIEVSPSQTALIVLNQVVTDTSKEAHVHFRRPPGSNQLVLWGTIPQSADPWREVLAIHDPALASAQALIEILRDLGVLVHGEARSRYRELDSLDPATLPGAEGTLLAERDSARLAQVIQVVNKVSQNLHAEMLLREVAFSRSGLGTLENGKKERDAFLLEAGVSRDAQGFSALDGSGLSRSDLATPTAFVTLLRYMWNTPNREEWLASLPIGALDGSLEHRFRRIAGAQRVHGKTGSLSHVNTLSGYIETRNHKWIAFSIMVNGTLGRESAVREAIDQLCAVFLSL